MYCKATYFQSWLVSGVVNHYSTYWSCGGPQVWKCFKTQVLFHQQKLFLKNNYYFWIICTIIPEGWFRLNLKYIGPIIISWRRDTCISHIQCLLCQRKLFTQKRSVNPELYNISSQNHHNLFFTPLLRRVWRPLHSALFYCLSTCIFDATMHCFLAP